MTRVQTLSSPFKRYRRPGDIVFAWVALLFSAFLLTQLFEQTTFRPRGKLVAQPMFWPAISLTLMTGFAALHLFGSMLSERIEGRWKEVRLWISALEYAGWFIAYAAIVPIVGYLPSTVILAVALTFRAGFRSGAALSLAALSAIIIVVLFKSFLKVKLPSGQIYEALPDGFRQIMLTYF